MYAIRSYYAAFQARWDEWSPYHGQRRTLLELTAIAPDLSAGTLVVLVAPHGAWSFDMAFRHALRYLYEGRATGHVLGADPLLYETRFEATGIRSIPSPAIREPWGEAVTVFPYDSVVAGLLLLAMAPIGTIAAFYFLPLTQWDASVGASYNFV